MAFTLEGAPPVPPPQTSPLAVLITGAFVASASASCSSMRRSAHPGNIVIAAVRDMTSSSGAAVKQLAARQPNVHVIQLDVSSESSIRGSLAEVERITDRLDVVINNAGIGAICPARSTR